MKLNGAIDCGFINETCIKCGNSQLQIGELRGVKFSECPKCHNIKYLEHNKPIENNKPTNPIVECPYCHSTNTRKISNTSKIASVATFGVFGLSKATKEWHCNNCKSNF